MDIFLALPGSSIEMKEEGRKREARGSGNQLGRYGEGSPHLRMGFVTFGSSGRGESKYCECECDGNQGCDTDCPKHSDKTECGQ